MFGNKFKVTIRSDLHARLRILAHAQGYSSMDELVTHLLEKAVAEAAQTIDDAAMKNQLKGLGYLE